MAGTDMVANMADDRDRGGDAGSEGADYYVYPDSRHAEPGDPEIHPRRAGHGDWHSRLSGSG